MPTPESGRVDGAAEQTWKATERVAANWRKYGHEVLLHAPAGNGAEIRSSSGSCPPPLGIPGRRLYNPHKAASSHTWIWRSGHVSRVVLIEQGAGHWPFPGSNVVHPGSPGRRGTSHPDWIFCKPHCCCTFPPHAGILPRETSPGRCRLQDAGIRLNSGKGCGRPFFQDGRSFRD